MSNLHFLGHFGSLKSVEGTLQLSLFGGKLSLFWGKLSLFWGRLPLVGGKVLLGVIINNWGHDYHFLGTRFYWGLSLTYGGTIINSISLMVMFLAMPESLVECCSLDPSFYIHPMTSTKLSTTRLPNNQSVHHKGCCHKNTRPFR